MESYCTELLPLHLMDIYLFICFLFLFYCISVFIFYPAIAILWKTLEICLELCCAAWVCSLLSLLLSSLKCLWYILLQERYLIHILQESLFCTSRIH